MTVTTLTRDDIIDILNQASENVIEGLEAKRLLKLLVTILDSQDISSTSPHLLIVLDEAKTFLNRETNNV